jgi:hypothetical protein
MCDEDDMIPEGYVRVTDVLKPFVNLSHIDPAVLQNAADRGTRVHKYCELYAQNMLIEDPTDECKGYVKSFKEWFDKNVGEVISLEKRLNHPILKISGKYDLLVSLKERNEICLIDIKTPQSPSDSWALQTAAYQILMEEVNETFIDFRLCLILDKKGGKAREILYERYEQDASLYRSALALYNYFNKRD